MTDPISLSGTAVGVISLGLQVCKEIISYCRAWHGSEREVQNILEKAELLNKTLDMSQNIISQTRTSDPDTADDLVEKVIATQDRINALSQKLSKYQGSRPSSGIRAQARKAAYPFQKEAFAELERDLDGIQMNLHTSLLAGIMKRMHSMSEMIALQTTLQQGASAQVLGKLTNMSLQVESSRNKDILPPGLVQLWCDQQTQILSLVQSTHQIMTRPERPANPVHSIPGRLNEVCTCQGIVSMLHVLPCPLSSRRRWAKTLIRSYYYSSRALRFVIYGTFSLNRGAGGFSIAPQLRFQFYRRENWSPAMDAIYSVLPLGSRPLPSQEDVNAAIDKLAQCFSRREGVPWELTLDTPGSLLEARFPIYDETDDKSNGKQVACWLGGGIPGKAFTHFTKLLIYLVESGAPVEATHDNRTALDYICEKRVFGEEEDRLILYLIDHGGSLTLRGGYINPIRKSNLRRVLLLDEDAVNSPEIAKIILKESITELEAFLKSGKGSANDSINKKLPLLSLAAGWPAGVRILLEFGADVRKGAGTRRDPLFSAARIGCRESVNLLIDAGAKVTLYIIWHAASFSCSPDQVVGLLISDFISKRRRLYDLAQSYLPQNTVKGIMSENEELPDISSAALYRVLVAQGIEMDPYLEIQNPDTSVYHDLDLPLSVFKTFYAAGLRDVDSRDRSGETPLMRNAMFRNSPDFDKEEMRLNWLISMGANPNRRLPQSCATVQHLLILRLVDHAVQSIGIHQYLANSESRDREITREALEKHTNTVKGNIEKISKKVIRSTVSDDCVCDCSRGGCTPLLMAQRLLLIYPPQIYRLHGINWFPVLLEYLMDCSGDVREAGSDVIRYLTFNALGLTHTCCKILPDTWRFKYTEKEEVEEIRNEEGHLLEDFRLLVDELISEFETLGIPLLRFLLQYWCRRVDEFCAKRDPLDEEYRRQLRRMGVSVGKGDAPHKNPIPAYLHPIISEESEGDASL